MKRWELLDRAEIPGGGELRLMLRDTEFSIMLGSAQLMNSRSTGSEEALATLTCDRLRGRKRPHILIGGLGMGFTLRAALTVLGPDARVTVAELVPAVVKWARGPMAGMFEGALEDDPRVSVYEGDVARLIASGATTYDAILLDVDNGPEGLTRKANDRLYDLKGLRSALTALKPNGVLAVWSSTPSKRFTDRLRAAGFRAEQIRVGASEEGGGARSVIWIATPAQAPHGSDATRPRRDERARLRSRRGASARNSRQSPGRE
jgi:spermidine synthase